MSPHVFHSLPMPITAEEAATRSASSAALRSNTHPPHSGIYQHPQDSSPSLSLPPSPHHPHSAGGSYNFGYAIEGDSGASVRGQEGRAFESYAETAALLLAHSALDTTWIHLNTARRELDSLSFSSIPAQPAAPQHPYAQSRSSSSAGNVEYYRPSPSHQQAGGSRRPLSPSSQASNRPAPGNAHYQAKVHQHPSAHPLSRPPVPVPASASAAGFPPHHFEHQLQAHQHQPQHHTPSSYTIPTPSPSQAYSSSRPQLPMPLPSLSMPLASHTVATAVSGARASSPSTASATTNQNLWGSWTTTTNNDGGSIEIPPWIDAGSGDSSLGAPYHGQYLPHVPHQAHYSFPIPHLAPSTQSQARYSQTPSGIEGDAAEMEPLVAAREIAELASAALGSPAIFAELDMMIAVSLIYLSHGSFNIYNSPIPAGYVDGCGSGTF